MDLESCPMHCLNSKRSKCGGMADSHESVEVWYGHERGVTVLHSHLESGQGRAVTDTCLCIAHHREVIVEGRHVDGDRLEGGVVRDACAGNSRVSKNQCLWGRKEAA